MINRLNLCIQLTLKMPVLVAGKYWATLRSIQQMSRRTLLPSALIDQLLILTMHSCQLIAISLVQHVEGFLGLSSGFLNSFTSSQDASTQFLDASGLKRTISVVAGQQLEFDWKFLAGDELPYNDTFFTIAGSDVFSVASVYSVGDYGEEEGTFSYVFSKSGDYIIGAAVMDGKDSSGDTYLSVDNFRLTGVTQSSKAEQSGFTQISYDLKASDVSKLKFDPGLNASNEPFANIKYQVEDSTGRLSNPVTLTVNVEPVNDVPIVTPDSFEFELNETDGLIKASGSMLLRDVDDDDRLSVRVSSIAAVGNPNSLADSILSDKRQL